MFFKQLELTTALRPALSEDETLLFVQDAVGLYEGKYKLPKQQKGHAYLTSFRICYVDDENPRSNSLAFDLRDVDRFEIQGGFLKSSPKIILYPKPVKKSHRLSTSGSFPSSGTSSPIARGSSPFQPTTSTATSNASWVCPICSFVNPVPSNFDVTTAGAHTPLPPCLACGIKPPLTTILKAAIAANTRSLTQRGSESQGSDTTSTTVPCPRCTFSNHPSMLSCEICGASLVVSDDLHVSQMAPTRPESPGPQLETLALNDTDYQDPLKLSFRAGGERIFHERLKGAMVQRKWLLRDAPPIPPPADSLGSDPNLAKDNDGVQRTSRVGIAGLERRGLETRRNNERVIGGAFEDLEALMASAKDIVALAEKFAKETRTKDANSVLSESAAALGMMTTKDVLGPGGSSESLYLSELSRNLAESLTDDVRGALQREGGIMSLVDLWAVFNGSRNGVELVSPSDFEKASRLWEKLKLPVRLRRFRSGLLVVQRSDRSDEKTIQQLQNWMRGLAELRGITAQEAAMRFGWSVGVAAEELEMAEEHGVVCRENNVEGLSFWPNLLILEEVEVARELSRGIAQAI